MLTATAYSTPRSDSGICAGWEEEEGKAASRTEQPWSELEGHYAAFIDALAAAPGARCSC